MVETLLESSRISAARSPDDRRVFRDQAGVTLSAYRTELRISLALEQLTDAAVGGQHCSSTTGFGPTRDTHGNGRTQQVS